MSERFLIQGHFIFLQYELCQVDREAVGVKEHKCFASGENTLAFLLQSFHPALDHLKSFAESFQECLFLFEDNLCNNLLLS